MVMPAPSLSDVTWCALGLVHFLSYPIVKTPTPREYEVFVKYK